MVLTAYIVHFGDWLFGFSVMLLALVAWHEFSEAFAHMGTNLWYTLGMAAVAFLVGCVWMGGADVVIGVMMAIILLTLSRAVLDHRRFTIQQACVTLTGIFYVGLSFSHLVLLRFMNQEIAIQSVFGEIPVGGAFIWIAFICTWASDTFAYFVGSRFGRRKLCPEISPGKTREGLYGGIAGTVLVAIGLGNLFSFSFVHMVVLGLSIALAATIGDLVESTFKRLTGIKDSGHIIPGHGGVLDRFDSMMFTVPLVYYYVQVFRLV